MNKLKLKTNFEYIGRHLAFMKNMEKTFLQVLRFANIENTELRRKFLFMKKEEHFCFTVLVSYKNDRTFLKVFVLQERIVFY